MLVFDYLPCMVWSMQNPIAAVHIVYIAMAAMRLDAPQPCEYHSIVTPMHKTMHIAAHIAALIMRLVFIVSPPC